MDFSLFLLLAAIGAYADPEIKCEHNQPVFYNNQTGIPGCNCSHPYYGTYCQDPCYHGHYDEWGQICHCDSRYAGQECDKLRCSNGEFVGGQCRCFGYYVGPNCDQEGSLWGSGNVSVVAGIIVAASVLGLAMVAFLLKGYMYNREISRREREARNSIHSQAPNTSNTRSEPGPPKYEDIFNYKRYHPRVHRIIDPLQRLSIRSSRRSTNRWRSSAAGAESIYSIDSELPSYENAVFNANEQLPTTFLDLRSLGEPVSGALPNNPVNLEANSPEDK